MPKAPSKAELQEQLEQRSLSVELLSERLAELEFALEDQEWLRLTFEGDRDFSRDGLRKITRMARMMFLKNPLIRRSVMVQTYYVWGQGVNIHARDKDVQKVVESFLSDPDNRVALTDHQARSGKEVSLQIDGNIFFCFFVNKANGRVRVRNFPADEIDEIITNPDDSKEVWYYKRTWRQNRFDIQTGQTGTKQVSAYYPDWRYRPKSFPASIGKGKVFADNPIMHVKAGMLDDMLFGVPDVYAVLDWAKAYKNFLEDWASIVKSLQRFAWRLSTKGGKKGVADAKTKLATTLSTSNQETNPAPLAGSTFIGSDGVDIQPLSGKTGANVAAEDGRMLRLMVSAGTGIPDTMLSGDANMGNLATAKTLDRPTELQMRDRQMLWSDVLKDIVGYAVEWSAKAPGGQLKGKVKDVNGVQKLVLDGDKDPTIDVIFPPILEHDIDAVVKSIVEAATLGGKPEAGTLPKRIISKLLLTTLGVDDVEELLDELFPEGMPNELVITTPPQIDPNNPNPPPNPQQALTAAVEAQFLEAVHDLQRALRERAA